jgi:prepilin-type N-terminal cleavage/methylation domain-containing protein
VLTEPSAPTPETVVENFMLLRPTWSDPAARSTLRQAAADRIAQARESRPDEDPRFTLIEVMLSMALVGLVLVGMNTFIFSMGELWGKGTDAGSSTSTCAP